MLPKRDPSLDVKLGPLLGRGSYGQAGPIQAVPLRFMLLLTVLQQRLPSKLWQQHSVTSTPWLGIQHLQT